MSSNKDVSRNLRILVLLPDAFGGYGGIAKFNRDLLTSLTLYRNCSEVVAIPRLIPNPCESLPEKLTYVTEGIDSKGKYISAVIKSIAMNPKFDLIICGHINLLPVAFLCKAILRKPLILVVHGIDAWQPTRSKLSNLLVRNIDAFISVSKLTGRRFVQWTNLKNKKEFILPNCVEAGRFGPAPKSQALLNRYGLHDKKVLMTLGRLVSKERAKGFDEVIEVLPDILTEVPNIAYLIAGNGPDRKRLAEKAERLGISDKVVFAGMITEDEKADHYRLADAYVMPSKGEGFGIVLLEAMACGIPTVGSRKDGSREALRDGMLGILVDPDSREEIKAGISEALSRPRGIIPDGLDYFSPGNFEQRLHGLINSVIH